MRLLFVVAFASCVLLQACSLLVETGGLSTGSAPEEGGAADADVSEGGADADAPVTDDAGDAGDADAAAAVLARDTFERTVVDGLGEAEVGGAWALGGARPLFAVSGGAARLRLATPADGIFAALRDVTSDSADVDLALSSDKLGSGSGLYLSVVGRQVGTASYTGKLVMQADGRIATEVGTVQNSGEILLDAAVSGIMVAPGEAVRVRLSVTGVSPTRVRLKLWKASAAEPSTWNHDLTDATPALQTKGSVGLRLYLSSTATNAPVVVSMDDFFVRPATTP